MTTSQRIEKIRDTFKTKKTRSYEWRVSQLNGLKRFLEEKNDLICEALWSDLRKGRFETETTEQGVVLGEINYTLENLRNWMRPVVVSTPLVDEPGKSEIRADPYGVVLIIGAWNFPVNLLLAPLVGAISGGNVAVLKPSELSPAVSSLMGQWVPKYLDSDAVIVVEGGVRETEELLKNNFDYIFFTGSTTVGKIIMKRAAETLTPVTLELGGKSPAIILDDAAIKVAARRIAWGKFMNAGQTCIAPDYVLIQPSIEEEFLRELKQAITDFYGSDPQSSQDFCRIVNDRNFLRLEKFLKDGQIYFGGKTDSKDKYIEPTVIKVSAIDSPVMQEEIFGPILPIIKIQNVDEAIGFVNSRPKPLALYLFSKSSSAREKVLDETSSGGVCINDVVMHMPSPFLPFGGVGPSGMGSYHGKKSFETFTHAKGVLTKSTWIDVPIRYAPYTDSKLKWVKRLS